MTRSSRRKELFGACSVQSPNPAAQPHSPPCYPAATSPHPVNALELSSAAPTLQQYIFTQVLQGLAQTARVPTTRSLSCPSTNASKHGISLFRSLTRRPRLSFLLSAPEISSSSPGTLPKKTASPGPANSARA